MTIQHDWMQTYTGQAFDPMHPDPSKIHIEDIAHALAMNCRYAGHVKRFYSVAEHSYHISHAVSPQNALWGLLHDASEAYIADIVRPVKHRMPEYREIERGLMWAICKKFDIGQLQPDEVSDADLRIVIDEKTLLLSPEPAPWQALEGLKPLGVRVEAWSPTEAELYFLGRFSQLYKLWT